VSAYRNTFGARERRRAEHAKAETALADVLPLMEKVYARRWSRIVGGSVGVFLGGIWPLLNFLPRHHFQSGAPFVTRSILTDWMLGSVALALLAAAITYPLARFRAKGALRSRNAIPVVDDEAADLAQLDAQAPFAWRERRLSALEAPSTALPMIATTAFAPLCLHLMFYLAWSTVDHGRGSLNDFSQWISVSMLVVGHAHIALAVCCLLFALAMSKLQTGDIVDRPKHRDWLRALGVATLVSAVPGILLLGVPPMISVATGLAFIPMMYLGARKALLHERAPIDAARELARTVTVDIADLEEHRAILLGEGPRVELIEEIWAPAPQEPDVAERPQAR